MARASDYGDRKMAVVEHLEQRLRTHSKTPTVRELAETFEVSPATMHSWLTKLGKEGLVEWTPGRHRSLHCTQQAIQLLSSQAGRSV